MFVVEVLLYWECFLCYMEKRKCVIMIDSVSFKSSVLEKVILSIEKRRYRYNVEFKRTPIGHQYEPLKFIIWNNDIRFKPLPTEVALGYLMSLMRLTNISILNS